MLFDYDLSQAEYTLDEVNDYVDNVIGWGVVYPDEIVEFFHDAASDRIRDAFHENCTEEDFNSEEEFWFELETAIEEDADEVAEIISEDFKEEFIKQLQNARELIEDTLAEFGEL